MYENYIHAIEIQTTIKLQLGNMYCGNNTCYYISQGLKVLLKLICLSGLPCPNEIYL